ncbi:MAG: hypothetical protein H6R27_1963 [Proteobacteria bacterium]|nr:hypothetical protein [Pseudomonadota bacterium]
MRPRTTVVLVDDHPVVRDGLSFLLGEQPDFEVLGQAADPRGALQVIAETRPDLLVLDLNLQGRDAIPLIEQLRAERPELRILVMSMHEEELYAEQLLGLGVHGYVMKQEEPAEFLRAIRRVAAGDIHLSAKLTARRAGRVHRGVHRGRVAAVQLTAREQALLGLVGKGLGTREIAAQLGISAKTVDSHRRNIREKLGLATARDLVRYAVRWTGPSAGSERRE